MRWHKAWLLFKLLAIPAAVVLFFIITGWIFVTRHAAIQDCYRGLVCEEEQRTGRAD